MHEEPQIQIPDSAPPEGGRFSFALILAAACVALAACRQDMHDAPRYEPLEASQFFMNGQSARMPVASWRAIAREGA